MATPAPSGTHVIFWNIRAGGGPSRAQAIALEIIDQQPDVVCLCECRPTFAGQLAAALGHAGLGHQRCTPPRPRTNGMLIAARDPIRGVPTSTTRLLSASLQGLHLTAAHIPDASASRPRKEAWAELFRLARSHRDQPHLIVGDFNADRAASPARDGVAIGRLAALGYRDLWLHAGNDPTEPTWTGAGGQHARIDHAYASEPLISRVESTIHHHEPRDQKLSDHSSLTVRLIPNDP